MELLNRMAAMLREVLVAMTTSTSLSIAANGYGAPQQDGSNAQRSAGGHGATQRGSGEETDAAQRSANGYGAPGQSAGQTTANGHNAFAQGQRTSNGYGAPEQNDSQRNNLGAPGQESVAA